MGFKIMSKFSINSDIIGQTMDSCIDVGDTYIILNFSKKDNQLQCMSNIELLELLGDLLGHPYK